MIVKEKVAANMTSLICSLEIMLQLKIFIINACDGKYENEENDMIYFDIFTAFLFINKKP